MSNFLKVALLCLKRRYVNIPILSPRFNKYRHAVLLKPWFLCATHSNAMLYAKKIQFGNLHFIDKKSSLIMNITVFLLKK